MSGGERLRVSQHSGRSGSAKHNDRSFMTGRSAEWRQEHASNIDTTRTGENVVWTWDEQTDVEASERAWYAETYQQAQDATNARYIREGHADRCKTPDDLYNGRLTRPEEMILQVGDRNTDIDLGRLGQALDTYLSRLDEWNDSHGGHMHVLSMALHLDESSPHVHIRRVWDYTDRDGLTRLGQAKALEAAGIELPDPGKPVGRYNNRKITFDAMARGWWQEACREQGWEIETEARPGMRHKEKRDFIYDQMTAEIDTARQERDDMTAQADKARQDATAADRIRQNATRQAEDAQQRAQEARLQAQETERQLSDARAELEAIEARTRALTAAEVERMEQSHRRLFGLRLVRADDWNRVMDTARQAEDATRRADAIEQERDGIIQRAQEQAAELTRQATQERDRAVQERDKARLQRDGLRRERDAIAKDVQQWIDKASDSRGVYLAGYLATERMAEKLAALMEYQEGWMLKSLDETMDRYISSIPAPMMPDSMREMLQEHREQDAQLETHKRVARELTDELEL